MDIDIIENENIFRNMTKEKQKILRNPQKNTITTNEQIQQSCKVKNQYTRLNCISFASKEHSKNKIKKIAFTRHEKVQNIQE